MERATRLELAIYSLGRKYSTTELRPPIQLSVFAETAPTRKPARTALAARHRFLVSTSGAIAPSACLYARRGALNYARLFNCQFCETAPPQKPARTALAALLRFKNSGSKYKNKTRSPRVLFYNNLSYFAIDASSINKIITCSPSLAL